MILAAIMYASFFHHKKKPEPLVVDTAQIALILEDRSIVAKSIIGARDFERDVKFAQYERIEIDAFERQIYKCVNDDDDKLDSDVNLLIELGDQLMAVDDSLHRLNVI